MKYFLKKTITLIITLFFVSVVTFLIFQVIPGDAALSIGGSEASPEEVEQIREELGLNQPLVKRYCDWAWGFIHGDFGKSYTYSDGKGRMDVSRLLSDKLPVTLWLALISVVIIVVLSIPLGILWARIKKPWLDGIFAAVNQLVMAIPSFFLGILVSFIFGLVLKWFTPGGYVSYKTSFGGFLAYMIFPAFALALPKIAMTVKFLQTSMRKELTSDYVRTAYAKGCTGTRVMFSHVLKNSIIPVITFLGVVLSEVMAGSIVVEQVFSVPGIGRLLISSISTRDFPVVQAIIMYIATVVMLVYFITDVLYKLADPRIGGPSGE
ncbi:MAG: ABC transporter permease [Lachnospiraceae bacterium]